MLMNCNIFIHPKNQFNYDKLSTLLYTKQAMSNLKLFQDKSIRSHWDEQEEQWYFSVIDV